MKLIDKLLFYISAPHCVGCGELLYQNNVALCDACEKKFNEEIIDNCGICLKPLNQCICANYYLQNHGIRSLHKAFRYSAGDVSRIGNLLIYALKKTNRNDVANKLADMCVEALQKSGIPLTDTVLVPIPRNKSSIAKYGYDQSLKLGKQISKTLSIPLVSCLVSNTKKEQKEMTVEERLHNPSLTIKNENFDFTGKTVLLLDDIVTTGATIGSASLLVKSFGAKCVRGVCVAISMKDIM